MPRPRLPARLWLDEKEGVYCIRDGSEKIRTGYRKCDREGAEKALERYLVSKRSTEKPAKNRRAEDCSCAEVIGRYSAKAGDVVARGSEMAQRAEMLLSYWGTMTLDMVDEDTCDAFVEHAGSDSYGRRCLEDFRAAINAYARAGFLRDLVRITLPKRSKSRIDWLTYEEAAALCKVALRERDSQVRKHRGGVLKLVTTTRGRWIHVAKFIVLGIATCSRSSRLHQASYVSEPGRPWVDLENGIFHRHDTDDEVFANKLAPTVPIGERALRLMRIWASDRVVGGKPRQGDRYVVQYAGRAADPKKAFSEVVEKARLTYPKLFKRANGKPKVIVRHTLRHTGVTWLAMEGTVPPRDICGYAGMTLEIFEQVYAHHSPEHMQRVLQAQRRKTRSKVKLDDDYPASTAGKLAGMPARRRSDEVITE